MNLNEAFAGKNAPGAEALLGLAQIQLAAFQRLSTLTFDAGKAVLEDGVAHTRKLLNARDVQEVIRVNAEAARPSLEKAMDYSRHVFDIAARSQNEMVGALETQAGELSKNAVSFLDSVCNNAPAGSDVVVAAMKSAIVATGAAYENLSRISKQACGLAEANLNAAAESAKASTKKAA